MSAEFETGFMVNIPSWHRLERAVLPDGTLTWEAAREAAGLTFEVAPEPVYTVQAEPQQDGPPELVSTEIKGWQAIVRDDKQVGDTARVLGIQKSSYEVIYNSVFGEVINTVLGNQDDDPITFEALMSLYGGRQIVALVRFDMPLPLGVDPSKNYRFCALVSRHDGQGGLRVLPTNTRVVCANTIHAAEMTDGKDTGITIRHTTNWKDRLDEVRVAFELARGESDQWVKFATELAAWQVKSRQRDAFLKRFLPISDDMTKQVFKNTEVARHDIRQILESPTCEGIADNGYGLLMAATEWSDYKRPHQTKSSFVSRQLLRKEPNKVRAAGIVAYMAGVKV